MPIDEETVLKLPESSYGKPNKWAKKSWKDFATAHQKKSHCWGILILLVHPTAKLGELPIGIPNNLVPYVMQTAAGIRENFSVWGDDYPTEDGTGLEITFM